MGENIMTEAADQTAEIQEQLDRTSEIAEQKKRKDDLQAARVRWREQETVKTEAFQKENFAFVIGSPRRYVGFKFVSGGMEVVTAEWTVVVSTDKLNHEEVRALIAVLQGNAE